MELGNFKFRIWDNDLETHIPMERISMKFEQSTQSMQSFEVYPDGSHRKIDNAKIEFYTGLKDKDGVPIFGGDILELKKDDKRGIYEVCFGLFEGFCIQMMVDTGITLSEKQHFLWKKIASVIGNIHKNPELWGVENEKPLRKARKSKGEAR